MSVQKWSQTAARVHLCNWVLKLFVYLSGFLWCSQPAMPTKSLDPTFQSLHASNTRWVIIASCIFAVLKDPFINWKTTPRMGLSRTFVGWTHRIRMMPGWKSCDRGSRNSTKTNSFVLDLLFLCDHFFLCVFVGQRHWVMDFWWQFFSISKQFLSTLRFQGELALGFQNMTSVMLVCRLYSHSASALKPLAWAILLLLQQFYFYISEREKRRRLCDYYNGSFTSILLKLQLTLFSLDSQLWHTGSVWTTSFQW